MSQTINNTNKTYPLLEIFMNKSMLKEKRNLYDIYKKICRINCSSCTFKKHIHTLVHIVLQHISMHIKLF